jgi:hypothetical protein
MFNNLLSNNQLSNKLSNKLSHNQLSNKLYHNKSFNNNHWFNQSQFKLSDHQFKLLLQFNMLHKASH